MSVEEFENGVQDIINRWDNKQENPSSLLNEEDALDIGAPDENSSLGYQDETEMALDEVKNAAKRLADGANVIELNPQITQIRKLQHELAEQYGLNSTSIGEGENRHLRLSK